MPDSAPRLLLTCEHGGNQVPPCCRELFKDHERLLASHRGWDPGALQLARYFSRRLDAPLVFSEVSRLVVELNRSPEHPDIYSTLTRQLDTATRERLLAQHYYTYRQQVVDHLAALLDAGQVVIHLSVHTFTPIRNGKRRRASIGLLYDPRQPREKNFCDCWTSLLRRAHPRLSIKHNYPYRGTDDGLTTTLRQVFASQPYAGIELEVNQAVVRRPTWFSSLGQGLAGTLEQALNDNRTASD